ncbi:hypothetical protein ACF07Y_39185 [Streptomyces sp. NPDC016566]|uniref:hypothetical protein n=1 Tax=Streptomyces sp. NPDC016566 TaxID=3364967 RepID=UPI0036F80425
MTTYEADRPEDAVGHLVRARILRERRKGLRGVALADMLLGQVYLGGGAAAATIDPLTAASGALTEFDGSHDADRALAWLDRGHSMAGQDEKVDRARQEAYAEFTADNARRRTVRSLEILVQSMGAVRWKEAAVALTGAVAAQQRQCRVRRARPAAAGGATVPSSRTGRARPAALWSPGATTLRSSPNRTGMCELTITQIPVAAA